MYVYAVFIKLVYWYMFSTVDSTVIITIIIISSRKIIVINSSDYINII